MKRNIVLTGLLSLLCIVHTRAQQYSAQSFFTNDYINTTASEDISCGFCGGNYEVFSLHASTSVYSSNLTFQPGYVYTLNINGSGTATGDLRLPGLKLIYYGISLGYPTYTTDPATAFAAYPAAGVLKGGYAGGLAFLPPFDLWQGYSTEDLTTNFLSNVIVTGSFGNSSTTGTSSCQFVVVGNSVTGVNIEPFPVLGDEPAFQQISEDGGTGTINPTISPTNTVLTINSVSVSQAPYITSSPLINGVTSKTFTSSNSFSSGILTAPPGYNVKVTVTSFGGKPNTTNATTGFVLQTPGVLFSNGQSAVIVSNGQSLTASTTVTFTMPSTGFVIWNGYVQTSSPYAAGTIGVR